MADQDKKRFYWLKLKKDFFKDHRIAVVEAMPNGKDYILFYLKLLCESTSHEGMLRFSETIPYNEQMLSVITNTNQDIVKSAVEVFKELGMMEVLTDGTIYMCEVEKMIGSETGDAKRKREYRKSISTKWDNVPQLSEQCPLEKEIEIEKELDKEKEIEIDNDDDFKGIGKWYSQEFGNLFNDFTTLYGNSKLFSVINAMISATIKTGYKPVEADVITLTRHIILNDILDIDAYVYKCFANGCKLGKGEIKWHY